MAANRSDAEKDSRPGRREQVTELLSDVEKKLKGKETATLSDYIRLIQLERELGESEPPREIIVRWVDSTGTYSEEQ